MKLGKSAAFSLASVCTAILLVPSDSLAGCQLPKSIGQVKLVERNITQLEKLLTGPDRRNTISGLRAKVSSLEARGRGFPAKAASVEKECRALVKLLVKIKAARKKRDVKLKKLRAERKDVHAEWKRQRARRTEEKRQVIGKGCGNGKKLSKEMFAFCNPLVNQFNAGIPAYKSLVTKFKQRSNELKAQIKAANAAVTKIQKSGQKRFQVNRRGSKEYQKARKSWDNELRKVWKETNTLNAKARQARKTKTPAKSGRGGQLGKLSGPLAPGKSGRTPGSKKHPPPITATEGGAMGQAKAARSMGRGGASATDRAAAASGAGRVFDRGDIKYPAAKSRGSAVDARGVKARSVPRHIRQKPRWQALDRKEQAYRADQAKAQERIETIKKKLQAGKGNKGELQVELVRAREKHDKIKSKIHVVKVEKEGFFLSLDEKPAIKKGKEKAPEPNAGKTKGAK